LITNTLRHANATMAEIIFIYNATKKNITLEYKDNGIGFDSACEEKLRSGMGLMNINQRIKILAGNFVVKSSIGKGTEVYIDFPVSETKRPLNLINTSSY
jgi:signal transduction histidine kinase